VDLQRDPSCDEVVPPPPFICVLLRDQQAQSFGLDDAGQNINAGCRLSTLTNTNRPGRRCGDIVVSSIAKSPSPLIVVVAVPLSSN